MDKRFDALQVTELAFERAKVVGVLGEIAGGIGLIHLAQYYSFGGVEMHRLLMQSTVRIKWQKS